MLPSIPVEKLLSSSSYIASKLLWALHMTGKRSAPLCRWMTTTWILLLFSLPQTNVLHFLQAKQTDELEILMEKVTDLLETAASTPDLSTARQSLLHSMERLRESLVDPLTDCQSTSSGDGKFQNNDCYCVMKNWILMILVHGFLGAVEICRILPIPKCHTCYWENDNFGKCLM